jgi:hypothetical protein
MMKKEKKLSIPDEIVMNKIYVVRGQKAMVDSDLAELYGVETRVLNQAVSRNLERFPEDFMFQLNEKEWNNFTEEKNTSNWGGRRKLPNVFTENGVLMLSSVLNSQRAIQVNIKIMRIFTRIRQMLMDNTEIRLAIEKLEKKTENNQKNIELVFQYIDELVVSKDNVEPRKQIGYKLPKSKK